MLALWARLKGYRTHIINALFAAGAIVYAGAHGAFMILSDPSVQGALVPQIPAKYAGIYAVVWAVFNAAMREATDTPSRLFRGGNPPSN